MRRHLIAFSGGSWARLVVACSIAATGCGSSSNAANPPSDGGHAEAALHGCQSGDPGPCNAFTTPTGVTIELGPYGAAMDANVGKGFENMVQSGDMSTTQCQLFAGIFMEDPKLTSQLLNTSQNGITLNFALYTVYRPANWKAGETYPVITWGNGTCAQPEGYGALLRYVASYGYVIVAANSRWVGQGSPEPMLHALDFAAAANKDPKSPYYGKLDMTKVGAMGHSQGAVATETASSDSRILDIIAFNPLSSASPAKTSLSISGDMDISMTTAAAMASAVQASTLPAAYIYYHQPAGMGPLRGHLVLMLTPDRVTGPTVAWWDMLLKGEASKKSEFEGADCTLCNLGDAGTAGGPLEFGEKGLN